MVGWQFSPTHASLRSATAIMITTSNSYSYGEEQDANQLLDFRRNTMAISGLSSVANRTCSTADNSIPGASSSTTESPVYAPLRPSPSCRPRRIIKCACLRCRSGRLRWETSGTTAQEPIHLAAHCRGCKRPLRGGWNRERCGHGRSGRLSPAFTEYGGNSKRPSAPASSAARPSAMAWRVP